MNLWSLIIFKLLDFADYFDFEIGISNFNNYIFLCVFIFYVIIIVFVIKFNIFSYINF